MGRLELILGFRGCQHEMDMEAENTISIALRVLTKSNKNRYDSYCLKVVPLFKTVKGLKEYLVQGSGEELKPATTGEDFTLGYHEEPHRIPFLIKLSDGCYAQFPVKFSLRFRACQSGLTSIVTRCHRR